MNCVPAGSSRGAQARVAGCWCGTPVGPCQKAPWLWLENMERRRLGAPRGRPRRAGPAFPRPLFWFLRPAQRDEGCPENSRDVPPPQCGAAAGPR